MSDSAPPQEPRRGPKPGAVVIGFLVLIVGEILILLNSGVSMPEIVPEGISTYAGDIDLLFNVILWITLFFFVLTEGLLVYFMLKYRARPGAKSKHEHGNHALELAWTFIPGLILFCLAVFQTGTWGDVKFKGSMPADDDPNAVVVQVLALQFEWNFRYPGPDREFGTEDDIIKRGELHVPAGRPIIVKLQTKDVLHSFWLPNVRLKQDLLPGQTIKQWFEILPRESYPATYSVVCAELCGNLHTTMKGSLVVHDDPGFDAWLTETKKKVGPHIPQDHDIWKFWRKYR